MKYEVTAQINSLFRYILRLETKSLAVDYGIFFIATFNDFIMLTTSMYFSNLQVYLNLYYIHLFVPLILYL